MGCGLRRAWRASIVAGIVAILGGCESPTLPLPPPELPGINTEGLKANELGEVKLTSQYGAEPNAIIVTYNLNPNVPRDKRVGGAQADAFGSWDTTIAAFSGDEVEITEQVGAEMSPPESVVIP